jgi:hypothetical protein
VVKPQKEARPGKTENGQAAAQHPQATPVQLQQRAREPREHQANHQNDRSNNVNSHFESLCKTQRQQEL